MEKDEMYESVLSEIIKNGYKPISQKKMKEIVGIEKSSLSSKEYDRMKTSLQRVLDFYNKTKIITIVTDTVQNEIKALKNRKDTKNLKPYIELLKKKSAESYRKREKEIQSKDENEVLKLELKNICDEYSIVEKTKSNNLVSRNQRKKEIDETLLPKDFNELEVDKNGYRLCYINGKYEKIKKAFEDSTSYELVRNKLIDYLDIDFNKEEVVTYEEKHFTTNNKITITKKIYLKNEVDSLDKKISPYDILYRLFLECDFKDLNGNLNAPIEFKIPEKDTSLFIRFFSSLAEKYDYNIESESMIKLSKSDMFQNKTNNIKEFIITTFTKVLIRYNEYLKGNSSYSLQLLLDLIETQSKINIKFIINDEEIEFLKTSINKLIVKENELDIKLSHSTITLTNLNQISLIQSYDIPSSQTEEEREKQFLKDVEKLKNILSEINDDNSNNMMATIRDIETIEDIFIF